MDRIIHLKCLICGKEYAPADIEYVCPDHGDEGIVDVVYDYEKIRNYISRESMQHNADYSIWRYKPFLPVHINCATPPLRVGWTPLYDAKRLAEILGIQQIWVKDDGQQPTASFKDRASALAIVKAREQGAKIIATASTGNAAAALSGLCASIGQQNIIFVPEDAPAAKIAQLLIYGSRVFLVSGTYDEAFDLCLDAARKYGWYNRNTGYNPYMTEGKKTVSFEVCEQLHWSVPDVVLVSVGDGCIIGGVHKGFKDLFAAGWIDKIPRIIGVQAVGSNYLAEAWERGEDVLTKPAIDAHTVADSICSGLPRDRLKAMAAVVETGGAFVTVSDSAILSSVLTLARYTGVFAEPAGATAYAGLIEAMEKNLLGKQERILLINTGNGLKDIQSSMKAVEKQGISAVRIAPNLEALEAALNPL